MMKVLFQFDPNTVPGAIQAQIVASNTGLAELEPGLQRYQFEAITFLHAWQLMGTSPQRFGNDISQYLIGAYNFSLWAPKTEFVQLDFGGSDFKRRVSEDMGASIACLFMVDSFGLDWMTITHIPANQNLDKLRPDFEGFVGADRYVFEAKGLTSLGNLTTTMDKAVAQAKSYPEGAVRKLALVTYLCSDCRQFKSQTFLLDPQLPANVLPDEISARRLHLIAVLDFAGLTETKKAYIRYLRAKFAAEAAERAGRTNEKFMARVEKEKEAVANKLASERAGLGSVEYEGHTFVVQHKEVVSGEDKLRILRGVSSRVLNHITRDEPIGLEDSRAPQEDTEETAPPLLQAAPEGQEADTSLFSDGTLFRIETIPTSDDTR